LALGTGVELVARSSPAQCRIDCAIPSCGDGVLDGGEVCDDGNTAPGDGCTDCFPD
jgi:cysteine-rich repeat protein